MASRPEALNRFDMRVEKGWDARSRRAVTISNAAKVHGRLVAFEPGKSTTWREFGTCL